MKRMLIALVAISLLPVGVAAQTIRAKDGDVILVENNDKVKIIRRRHANVRVLYNAEQRWVLVLADWLSVPGGGDGRVDYSYSFQQLTSAWPLGERWEGAVYLDEYDIAGRGIVHGGLGLTTGSGLIQFLGSIHDGRTFGTDKTFADPAAVAVLTFRGSGAAMEREAFDVAERRALTRMAQEAAGGPVTGPGGIRSSVSLGIVDASQPSNISGLQPVRVGGNIRAPIKIKHVDGVLPGAARQAGVFGMVILEIIIGTDGTVQSAKVLRSIPMLDQAAIDAVKQWTYEPTLLNGTPVPVIMTATVNFTQ